MMITEGSTKIVNLMTPGARVLVFGHGYKNHIREYALSSTLSIYITLVATCFVLRDFDADSLCLY